LTGSFPLKKKERRKKQTKHQLVVVI